MGNWVKVFVIIILLCNNAIAGNITFDKANQCYHNKQYTEAAELYNQMIKEGVVNIDVYYNAGNAYYKLDEPGQALWCYTKALQYQPYNTSIKENLMLSKKLLQHKYSNADSWALVTQLKKIVDYKSLNTWCWLALGLFILAAFIKVLSKYSKLPAFFIGVRKFIWFTWVISFILVIASYVSQKVLKQAIIVHPVMVKNTEPYKKATKKLLGTQVWIIEEKASFNNASTVLIQLPDGKRVWVNKENIREL